MIDAHLLQIVEEPGLGRPESSGRVFEQGGEGLAPAFRLLVVEPERVLEPLDQAVDLGPGGNQAGRAGHRGGEGPQDGRADHVSLGPGRFGPPLQPSRLPTLRHRRVGRRHEGPQLVCGLLRLRDGPGVEPRVRGTGKPGPLQQRLAVHVLRQDGLDGRAAHDGGEGVGQQRGGEVAEFKVTGSELDVDGPVVARRKDRAVIAEDGADLVEHDRADPLDPRPKVRGAQLPRREPAIDRRMDMSVIKPPPEVEANLRGIGVGEVLWVGPRQQEGGRRPGIAGPQAQLVLGDDRAESRAGDGVALATSGMEPEERKPAVPLDHPSEDGGGIKNASGSAARTARSSSATSMTDPPRPPCPTPASCPWPSYPPRSGAARRQPGSGSAPKNFFGRGSDSQPHAAPDRRRRAVHGSEAPGT